MRIDASFHGNQANKIEPILSSGSLGVIPYDETLLRTLACGFKYYCVIFGMAYNHQPEDIKHT